MDKPSKGSMRDAYGEALVKLGAELKDIVVVGADTTGSIKTSIFGAKFPDRFFNVGIAESNLVSVAAGLAIAGKIAFASTYAVFAPGKCVDQIRNAIAYPNVNMKLVASHAGISVGPDGASHQELEDIATMRVIPNMHVVVPSDPGSTARLVEILARNYGPFYMRIARPDCPIIYTRDQASSIMLGQSMTLRDGNDGTIIACGLLVYEALLAARKLATEHSLNVRVIDMLSIKPIDQAAIVKSATETGMLVTAEEHNVIGGLGGAVAEVVAEKYPVIMRRVGTQDTFGESGESRDLMIKYGLTSDNISERILELKNLARK
ncbi:MAG: transketolase C-terminal domain-containing protein [archaeon]|nr:transketolase C-terminal domain-containing protein [archaeon]